MKKMSTIFYRNILQDADFINKISDKVFTWNNLVKIILRVKDLIPTIYMKEKNEIFF